MTAIRVNQIIRLEGGYTMAYIDDNDWQLDHVAVSIMGSMIDDDLSLTQLIDLHDGLGEVIEGPKTIYEERNGAQEKE